MKKLSFYILFSMMISISFAFAVDITSYKNHYDSGESTWIQLENRPNNINGTNWIGIYPANSNNDWENMVQWSWTKDTSATEVDPGDWYKFDLPDGNYEARLFFNNSFIVESKVAFKVSNGANKIVTSKKTYSENDIVSVTVSNLSGNKDWVGIYPKGSNNDWENVVQWDWVPNNGTFALNRKKDMPEGKYEARLFFNNSYIVEDRVSFSVKNNSPFGPQSIVATPEELGTKFASPNGEGEACNQNNPCSIYKAVATLVDGDVLFLRGGKYKIKNKVNIENNNIIIESFPGEVAVLDGQNRNVADVRSKQYSISQGIQIHSDWTNNKIRNIEVKGMARSGIVVSGQNNVVEGCRVHNNFLTGISVNVLAGDNLIQHNKVYDNSDAGLTKNDYEEYANGGNTDGIQIVGGNNNKVIHNLVYSNSDDGIDTWLSSNSLVKFNISHSNGEAAGNGEGFKAGGHNEHTNVHGRGTIVENNIAYSNKSRGFTENNGINVTFRHNTSYGDSVGYRGNPSTLMESNIAHNNADSAVQRNGAGQINNSWDLDDNVQFISIDPNSPDFLKPIIGSAFENIGAYGGL